MTLAAAVAAIAVVGTSGCDPEQSGRVLRQVAEQVDEINHEALRVIILQEVGPQIIPSIVFASAPTGGPPALSTLCSDAGWRTAIAGPDPAIVPPSVLETPNPNIQVREAALEMVASLMATE
jgi:hypothetical protein